MPTGGVDVSLFGEGGNIAGHGVEGEIPPAGGRRYLGALPGGPGKSMTHSRRA